MAIITKTDWKPTSVPTAEDFKRIENNIAALDNNKEPKISILPVNKGGTGVQSISALRNAIELGSTLGPLKVQNGGTGKSNFTSGHFIVGNGNGEFLTQSPASARVGYATNADKANKAVYDDNGNNIAKTYLGTATTLLLGPDRRLEDDKINVSFNGNFSNYKYIIFLARDVISGTNVDYSYCMVEQKLLRDIFNDPERPLAITRDGARLKLYRSSNSSVYIISRQFNNRLTIYGVN